MEKLIKYYMHVQWRKGALLVNLKQFKHNPPPPNPKQHPNFNFLESENVQKIFKRGIAACGNRTQ